MIRFLLVLVVLVLAIPLVLFILSSAPQLQVESPAKVIGTETPVTVKVTSPHGVRSITAWVEQGGARHQVFAAAVPAVRWRFLREKEPPRSFTMLVGTNQAKGLKEGKARVVVEAQANDLRAATASHAWDVEVNTKPPSLTVDNLQHYINQGGSELVTFNVSGAWTEAGVRVGKHRFRSFPMPGGDDTSGSRFSLFAFPWDVPADTAPVVYAISPAGVEVTNKFWFKIFAKRFRSRELEVDDAFLEKVVNQIDPGGQGELIDRFLHINGKMRQANNQTLADLRHKTEQRFLWSGPFIQLSNSKVESQFADTRTYLYKGKKVDVQTHLGFDLSVVQNVGVQAANDGKVILAEPLGIYGNCVVVDHGYGLQSIYAHLSQIGVKPGDMVKKGQELGKSGATGLAGGDHLHYSMQVDGVQVNPVEWWDDHWIQDRIRSKVQLQ